MGGRGASGPSMGGGGGGVNTNNIESSTSLISERESKRKYVDEVLSVFKDAYDKYGFVTNDAQIVKFKAGTKDDVSTLAYWDSGDNIAVNERFFNENMEQAYIESVKTGFHPSNGNKTGMEAVISHEMGHALTGAVAKKQYGNVLEIEKAAHDILMEAKKITKHKSIGSLASKISGYALTNNCEAIAEAFSDVYCNFSNAKRESIAIVDVINKKMNGK